MSVSAPPWPSGKGRKYEYVTKICGQCGKNAFIPCMCAGMPGSAHEDVYEAVSSAIAKLNG